MAYAAVVLLLQNLEEILRVDSFLNPMNRGKMEYLQEEARFLHMFLMDSQEKGYDCEFVREVEVLIRNVAYKAADYLDSRAYISNLREPFSPERVVGRIQMFFTAHQSLTLIIEEFESVKLKIMRLSENKNSTRQVGPTGNSSAQLLSANAVEEYTRDTTKPFKKTSLTNAADKLVGINDKIKTLLDRLTGEPSHRQVIPILGMGGIGKSTLAQTVYNKQLVINHFDERAWITVSLGSGNSIRYKMRQMLLGILQGLTNIPDEILTVTAEELGVKLYKTLKYRRYLVVLDDMWDTKAWDFLGIFLPDDDNGSRIILTSRLAEVADHISPRSSIPLHLLTDGKSWELLESKLFAEESCPPELIEIGKRIANGCHGLPLAIVVVAGLLSKMRPTLDSWSEIAESVDRLVVQEPERCINILALSYNNLPNPLKVCFLYMGAFPGDHEIPVSKLIWLWMAEGFIQIQPAAIGKCLEEVAYEYLEDLVSRNLVLVIKKRSSGRYKTCHIHDLLREFCVREAKEDNFLHVIKRYDSKNLKIPISPRRISLHASMLHYYCSMTSVPLIHSFLCFDVNKIHRDYFLLDFMHDMQFQLLRVLDILLVRSNYFPIVITELVHLRYLALAVNCELPASISKLQNLQTLIIDNAWEGLNLPKEIWKLTHLRHLHLKNGCYLSLPCIEEKTQLGLKNIQTLSTLIGTTSCSEEVLACLPRLRKLAIFATESDSEVEWRSNCLINLVCLSELETLKCSFLYTPRKHRLPNCNVFPQKLKKLTLHGSYLPWEDIDVLGMLPNLEVLKLRSYAFNGDAWKQIEEGFLKLRHLVIENSDPRYWDADSFHFPSLECLMLRDCKRLMEIPRGIGDIETLEMVELHDCGLYLVHSARELHEQQKRKGNNELQIRITWGDNHPLTSC